MEKKPSSSSLLYFFKRLNRKSSGGVGEGSSPGGSRRWKLKSSAGLRWKRRFNLHLWFVNSFLFKIVSAFEAVFLVSSLCLFFLCCGCHF